MRKIPKSLDPSRFKSFEGVTVSEYSGEVLTGKYYQVKRDIKRMEFTKNSYSTDEILIPQGTIILIVEADTYFASWDYRFRVDYKMYPSAERDRVWNGMKAWLE